MSLTVPGNGQQSQAYDAEKKLREIQAMVPPEPVGKLKVFGKESEGYTQDQAARILRLQGRTGIDRDLLSRNVDTEDFIEMERRVGLDDFDPEKIWRDDEILAGWLSESPDHIAIARPDLGNLKSLRRLFYRKDDPSRPLTEAEIDGIARRAAKAGAQGRLLGLQSQWMQFPGFDPGPEPTTELAEEEVYRETLSALRSEEAYVTGEEKIGPLESIGRRFRENQAFFVPVGAAGPDVARLSKVYFAAERIQAGEASEEDQDIVVRFGRLAEAAERRGTSIMGNAAEILAELPAFAGEFALTGPAYGGAKIAIQKTIRAAVRKALGARVGGLARKAA